MSCEQHIAIYAMLFLVIIAFAPERSFSQLALGRKKFVGNAITSGFHIPSNYLDFWNQVTPGNDGKWGSVEASQGVFTWSALDDIYNLALANGILFKEHNLVWGSQQPSWITSLDSADQRAAVEAWIDSVGSRYPQMSFVDVVNEPFHTPPPYTNALGGSGKTGWDWVITAFTWARKYCPSGAKLLINEYNILQDNGITSNYIALIDTLIVRGLIDGVGIQGHYFEFKRAAYLVAEGQTYYSYSISTLKYNLDRIASSTGLPIYITEFDIDEQDDNIQLQNYETYFPLFYEDPAIKGMTLWGYNYGDTWKPYAYLDSLGIQRQAFQWLSNYLIFYLSKPIIISPANTTISVCNPFMVWHSSIAASSYRLQIATDNLFSSVVVDSTVSDTTLQMRILNPSTKYYWRVRAFNASDTSGFANSAYFTTGDSIETAVNKLLEGPTEFKLLQNYPNPFNPTTVIEYQLPVASYVSLKVYDILGREVAVLVNENKIAGYYNVTFNAKNMPSGVYFYRITTGSYSNVKKLILLK